MDEPQRFDLVIAGGDVIDGTGGDRVRADVGITGDRIAAIGDLSEAQADERIDAAGKSRDAWLRRCAYP